MGSESFVNVKKKTVLSPTTIHLPSSKSESNRALIINSFAKGELSNVSNARDTQTMMRLLQSTGKFQARSSAFYANARMSSDISRLS